MKDSTSGLLIVGGLAAGLALLAASHGRLPELPGLSHSGELSPIRNSAIERVKRVVPSRFGDPKFSELAPSYKPEDPAWRERIKAAGVDPDRYTTCAELPRYVGEGIGINTHAGLKSIRDVARAAGAWVEATGNNAPKPGDFFLVGKERGPEVIPSHVGIIIKADGSTWTTADAGQGTHGTGQEAREVSRPYDAKAVTLGGVAGPRFLLGWLDLDLYAKSKAHA